MSGMNRHVLSLSFGVATLLSSALAFAAEGSGGVCIDEKAKANLNACAVTGREFSVSAHGAGPTMNFKTAPPPAELKKKDEMRKPGGPTFDKPPRDERRSRLEARQRGLLVSEIQGIERLFETTPKNAADRPVLMRRMAEDYVELESAAFRDKTNAEIARDEQKKTNPQAAGQKQADANTADTVMKNARGAAIKYYSMLKNEYPKYPQLDEVLYYLAFEYEQASDFKTARAVYYELINSRPDSKYVPNAYLAFGELFFNEAQGDPSKWEYAEQAYRKVIDLKPPPENRVYGYAYYKLAYCYWNEQQFEKAMTAFKKTIEFGVAFTQLPGATKIAEAARNDIIPVYALKGDPDKAYNFFKPISGDAGGTNDKTYQMMDRLGLNYLDTGHYQDAINLYRDLMSRDRNGVKHCVYQAHITEATMALKSSDKNAIRAELESQIKNYSDYKNGGNSAEAKFECANKTAALVSETAMAWHLEAVGSGGQRGTGDQKTMTAAAYLYKKAADTWTAKEFEKFEFPRIQKEDWPTIYKIKYAMADLLYFQEKWAECGPAFDSVVAENPEAKEAPESAYAAVLCYQKVYEQTHARGEGRKGAGNLPGQKKDEKLTQAQEDEKLKPKELSSDQKGMIGAFNKYICYIKPPANDTKGQDQLVEVKYARARTYFEAQRWEEAGLAFRDIALSHADKEVGVYAAQLYLESINVLGLHYNPRRPGCFTEMKADVPKFIELYCAGDKATKNADQCLTLSKVQVDLLRLEAQVLVERGDKSPGTPQSIEDHSRGGQLYFDLFRKACQEPAEKGQPAAAERCDEIAYNSARAFQAARLIGRAIAARKALIDYDEKTKGKSPLAKKARYEIGGNYQAIAVYDVAAKWFEEYARSEPGADKADQALSDAVILRLGLGQENEAINDAKEFTKNYGAKKPAQTASIQFAIGAHYAEKEDWGAAKSSLEKSMSIIDKSAPDIQVQSHATLARAMYKVKCGQAEKDKKPCEDRASKSEYTKVRGYWNNPDDAIAKIKAAYPTEDDAQKERRIGRALNAVGEAYFMSAEEMKRTQVDVLKFPEYKGNGKKDDVLNHIKTKVVQWYTKKQAAIQKAETEYAKIMDLKPVRPPKWVIASASQSGLLWGELVDDFRKAPIPAGWDGEQKAVYFESLDAASEPFKVKHAKPALELCLKRSLEFQYFDQYSRACEVWLGKNYKQEYHVVDELRGAPTLPNSGLDEKIPPVLVGGSFWRSTPPATEKSTATDEPKKPTPPTKPKPKKK